MVLYPLLKLIAFYLVFYPLLALIAFHVVFFQATVVVNCILDSVSSLVVFIVIMIPAIDQKAGEACFWG